MVIIKETQDWIEELNKIIAENLESIDIIYLLLDASSDIEIVKKWIKAIRSLQEQIGEAIKLKGKMTGFLEKIKWDSLRSIIKWGC